MTQNTPKAAVGHALRQVEHALEALGPKAESALAMLDRLTAEVEALQGDGLDLWAFACGAVRRATSGGAGTCVVPVVAPDLPRACRLDIPLLREAVEATLGDAVGSTREGHVVLHIGRSQAASGRLLVCVEDTREAGVHTVGSQQRLSAVSARLRALGLRLSSEQPVSGGCQRLFELPFSDAPAGESPALAGRMVLVIDAHVKRRQGTRAALVSEGARVQLTGDPRAALRLLASARPDAVVLEADLHGDVFLPLLRRLRQAFSGPIVCVGASDRELAEEARLQGADAWRSHPLGRPLAHAAAEALLERKVPTPPPEAIEVGSGPCVLLVDDDASVRREVQALLAQWGVKVQTANSGPAALERISAHAFDLVLLDCRMPGMNGFETVTRLRALGLTLPVIGLTDPARGRDGCQALEAGMNDYLSKRIEPSMLRAALQRWVRTHTPGRRPQVTAQSGRQGGRSWAVAG